MRSQKDIVVHAYLFCSFQKWKRCEWWLGTMLRCPAGWELLWKTLLPSRSGTAVTEKLPYTGQFSSLQHRTYILLGFKPKYSLCKAKISCPNLSLKVFAIIKCPLFEQYYWALLNCNFPKCYIFLSMKKSTS